MAGPPGVPVYLLDGPEPALFDAGNSVLASLYIQDVQQILGHRSPARLFITHSHFDHLGAAWYLKQKWPGLRVAASAKTKEILAKPRAVQVMTDLSRAAGQAIREWGVAGVEDTPFQPVAIDDVLTPGHQTSLAGGRTVHVLATPGHTWDFISYWIPEEKILIASEAAGCEDYGHIATQFLVDFDAYRRSLESLAQLDPDVLCVGHHFVFTGRDARAFLDRSLAAAADYLNLIERMLDAEDGDVDRAAARVKAEDWDPKPFPKQPEAAYTLNTIAQVRTIKNRMERGQRGV